MSLDKSSATLATNVSNLNLESDGEGTALGTKTCTSSVTHAQSQNLKNTINDLINRCKFLHDEVETYVAAVESSKLNKTPNPVEYRSLRNDFRQEFAFVEKLANLDLTEEKARHFVNSSNLVYHEALWDTAKRSTGLLAFRKYFFWNRHQKGNKAAYKGLSLNKGSQAKGKSSALVDIVASDGLEWIRVSTVSEKRLLFDLAKLGWQNDSDSTDEEDVKNHKDFLDDEDDDEDQVDVVRQARELARAARANPTRGRPPKVTFILTRIAAGKLKEVDAVIEMLRATGANILCANDIAPAPPLSSVLPKLLVDRSRTLSDVLNIDCTILLALISDISHTECPILDWYPAEVRAQIKEEEEEKLLPTHLYPAIGNHSMVCTQEAADQMNLIVDTLATDKEKTRANLLLRQKDHANTRPKELVDIWKAMSDHETPQGFQLPIKVMPSDLPNLSSRLPAVATKVAEQLNELNQAIFFYGWAEGLTTLSSNRARARQIETAINEGGLKDGEAGPHVWLCGESRSLIAKQGRRK